MFEGRTVSRAKWFVLGSAALQIIFASSHARASDLLDWNIDQPILSVGDFELGVSGEANGSAYGAQQPAAAGLDRSGVTGSAAVSVKLSRTYDSGLGISARGTFELYHDQLSGDQYGNAFVQKAYLGLETGLGQVQLGEADGAAYQLAITGPTVDDEVSLDNSRVTFFRNPFSSGAFTSFFKVNTSVESSLNYAKLSYLSPRLFGVEIGASFTPSEGKDVLPFLSSGPHIADRQQNIWEIAASYVGNLGPTTVGASGAVSFGHNAAKTFGHAGLTDWALGTELSYEVNDDWTVSAGASFREANAYEFQLNNVLDAGATTGTYVSAKALYQSWTFGAEYTDGRASGGAGVTKFNQQGVLLDVGYTLNTNLQVTGGWEHRSFDRSAGVFYNGQPRIGMSAGFLHLLFHV